MWTPNRWLRDLAAKQAREELENFLGDSKKTIQREVGRQLASIGRDWAKVTDNTGVPNIAQTVVLLEQTFPKPVEFFGVIDTAIIAGESARIELLTDIRRGESLTPLLRGTYDGPVEDCLIFHESVVEGKVVVRYEQLVGLPKQIWFRFYTRCPQ
jgi:hypothetical protein